MMVAILISNILNSAILNKKDFTHSFPLNLMMAAILNSTILDSAILHKKLHSFILTHLDDGSHLEFCHLGFRHLVIFSQIHSKTLWLHSDSDSNKFNLTQTHLFSLNLMMAAILNSATLNFSILDSAILHKTLTHSNSNWLSWWWQPSWILSSWIFPSWIQPS